MTEPAPRQIYLSAVEKLAEPYVADGWRYAKSGPHLTKKWGPVTAKISFSSSGRNVAGAAVKLKIAILITDETLGAWRASIPDPRRTDDVVATPHLGHLLDEPRWQAWNLADPSTRAATVAEIAGALRHAGEPFLLSITEALASPEFDPDRLRGLVDTPTLIEYFVREGRPEHTSALIKAELDGAHERARESYTATLNEYRSGGLPERRPTDTPKTLAFLVARFDLPV